MRERRKRDAIRQHGTVMPGDTLVSKAEVEGKTLCGRYILEAPIGAGGMASVYRGSHRNGNRVAIKILHPELAMLPEVRARFLREGYVANKVGHAGAVRVLDDDTAEDGTVFLVMELLDGETLEAMIARRGGTLPPATIVPLARQLLEILAAAHRQGIVHRDIKPDNLFVQSDWILKVLDFGIARMAGAAHATRTGAGAMGTPVYMAPEQARGQVRNVDAQTDVWAVGAVIFRSLTGRHVYEEETPEMTMVVAATQPPPLLGTLMPTAEPELCAVVDRALAPAKDARWSSATEMLEALNQLGPDRASTRRTGTMPGDQPRQVSGHDLSAVAPTIAVAGAPAASVRDLGWDTRAPAPPGAPAPSASSVLARGQAGHSARTTMGLARGVPPDDGGGSRSWLPIVAVLAVLGVGGGAVAVVGAVVLGSSSRTAAAPDIETMAASRTPSRVAEAGVEEMFPAATAEVPTIAAENLPKAGARAVATSAPTTPGASAKTSAARATVSSPSANPGPSARPTPGCTPNFFVDGNGVKHFKEECL